MEKQFILHKESGLLVSRDGEIFVPQSGSHPAHYTYGCDDGKGYRQVGYQWKNYLVHRLVAEVYLQNPDGKKEIDHINTNRSDNRVENLRWSTHPENQNNPLSRQKMQGKKRSEETRQKIAEAMKGKHHNPKKPVVGVHKTTGDIVEFESATDAMYTLNIAQSSISACCRGELKSAGGYVWTYLS